MQCPFCGREAKNIAAADYDGVVLKCLSDDVVEFASHTFARICALEQEERATIFRTAKRAGNRLIIHSQSPGMPTY